MALRELVGCSPQLHHPPVREPSPARGRPTRLLPVSPHLPQNATTNQAARASMAPPRAKTINKTTWTAARGAAGGGGGGGAGGAAGGAGRPRGRAGRGR